MFTMSSTPELAVKCAREPEQSLSEALWQNLLSIRTMGSEVGMNFPGLH